VPVAGSIQDAVDLAATGDTVYIAALWSGAMETVSVGYKDITIAGEDPLNPPVIPAVIAGEANTLTLRDLVIGEDGRSQNTDLDYVLSNTTFNFRVYSLGVDLVLHGVSIADGQGYGILAIDASVDAEDLTASGFEGGSALFVAAIGSDEALEIRSSTFATNPAGAVRVDGYSHVVSVSGTELTFSGNGSTSAGYGSDLRLAEVSTLDVTDMISSGGQVSTSAGLGGSIYVYTQAGPLELTDVLFDSAYGFQGRAVSVEGRQDRTDVTLTDVRFEDRTGLSSGYGPLYVAFTRSLALDQVVFEDTVSTYGAAFLYYVDQVQLTDSTFSGVVNFTAAAGGAGLTAQQGSSVTLNRTRVCDSTAAGALLKVEGDITVLGLIVSGSYASQAISSASGSLDVRAATFTGNTFNVADVSSGATSVFARNVLFGDENTGIALLTTPSTADWDYLFVLTDEDAVSVANVPAYRGDHPQTADSPEFDGGWLSDCSTYPYVSSSSVAYNTGDPDSPDDADGTAPDIGAMSGESGTWWVDADTPTGDVGNDTGGVDTGTIDTGTIDTGTIDTGTIDTGVDTGDTDTDPVDADADGYPLGTDCDDEAPQTHPGAWDVPDDGEDQDCDGADALSAVGGGCACSTSGAEVGGGDVDPAAPGHPAGAGKRRRAPRRRVVAGWRRSRDGFRPDRDPERVVRQRHGRDHLQALARDRRLEPRPALASAAGHRRLDGDRVLRDVRDLLPGAELRAGRSLRDERGGGVRPRDRQHVHLVLKRPGRHRHRDPRGRQRRGARGHRLHRPLVISGARGPLGARVRGPGRPHERVHRQPSGRYLGEGQRGVTRAHAGPDDEHVHGQRL